jgi:hypothetical protein
MRIRHTSSGIWQQRHSAYGISYALDGKAFSAYGIRHPASGNRDFRHTAPHALDGKAFKEEERLDDLVHGIFDDPIKLRIGMRHKARGIRHKA